MPTRKHLFDMALSVQVSGYQSVKFNYEHFIAKNTAYQLKSYYYTLSESQIDTNQWMEQFINCAMSLVPKDNRQPIILSIDDTMVEKFGNNFEHCSTLFDYARHNGSDYLKGHNFVCLLLSVPIQNGTARQYLHIPVHYCIWTKEESKLELAAKLVRSAMARIDQEQSVILCCDS